MSIFTAFFSVFGGFLFLYFLWNRLKEDYTSPQIFSLGFTALIGLVLFYLASFFLAIPATKNLGLTSSGVLFWGSALGVFLGFLWGAHRQRMRFFETLEAVGIGGLFLMVSVFAVDVAQSLSAVSFLAMVAVLILVVLFYYFESKYRDYGWYRSGKVGFSGMTVLGLFFLLRAVVALVFPFVLSFVQKFETLISGAVAFLFFFGVLRLSQKK